MRTILLTILLSILYVGAIYGQAPQPSATPAANYAAYVRPDKNTRLKWYAKSMFGPEAFAQYAVNAGFSTWTNTPKEWGPHWNGFGKRFASNLGKGIIGNTTRFALEEAFKLDSHYYLSQKRDAESKIKNAVISPFTTRNRNGKLIFGFPRLIGTFTAGIVATEVWYPKRYGLKDGLVTSSITVGTSMLMNLLKEFIHK